MTVLTTVKRNQYFDSVRLLRASARLNEQPGVEMAAVVMATDLNRELLARSGLLIGEAQAAGPNDLVIALRADDEAVARDVLRAAEKLLRAGGESGEGSAELEPRSLRSAAGALPADTPVVAVISVPGQYAAAEAWQALSAGMHVFLFSDNVPIGEEIELKRYASEHGLLVMGPDCGTAILNGLSFGFANAVRRGEIGLIGASGTGLQEVSVLVHQAGGGVSHVVGCGSRDLEEAVGGISTLQALDLLSGDPSTECVVLVSKPPSDGVARRLLEAARGAGKRVIACFLGWDGSFQGIEVARTLEDAARLATGQTALGLQAAPANRVLGAYCGGTLAAEARLLLPNAEIVDFGDDEYTRGRAHPMIDPTLRNQAILDSPAELVLLDFVLGTGSSEDPAGAFAAIAARARAKRFFGHIVGTDLDRQDLARQEAVLTESGVRLFASNAAMARAAQVQA